MRVLILIAAFTLFPHMAVHADFSENSTKLKAHWAETLASSWREQITTELAKGGLSRAESERALLRFANDSVMCVFDAAKISAKRRNVDFEEQVSRLDSIQVESYFASEFEFDELAAPCFYHALANAGVQISLE